MKKNTQFAVIGLGRFGMSIVQTLAEYEVDILAVDEDAGKVQEAAKYATYVLQGDITDENTALELGLGNFDVVLLCMAEDFEASLLATMIAKEQGAEQVVVKARGERQKKILESIGADTVILPEREMGEKVARSLVGASLMDVLQDSVDYEIAERYPDISWVGKNLLEADIRAQYGFTVLAIRRSGQLLIPVTSDMILQRDDILITISQK